MTDDPHVSHVLIVANYTEATMIRRQSPEFGMGRWVTLAACDRPTEAARKLHGRIVDRIVATDYARTEGRHFVSTLELVLARRITGNYSRPVVERYEP